MSASPWVRQTSSFSFLRPSTSILGGVAEHKSQGDDSSETQRKETSQGGATPHRNPRRIFNNRSFNRNKQNEVRKSNEMETRATTKMGTVRDRTSKNKNPADLLEPKLRHPPAVCRAVESANYVIVFIESHEIIVLVGEMSVPLALLVQQRQRVHMFGRNPQKKKKTRANEFRGR